MFLLSNLLLAGVHWFMQLINSLGIFPEFHSLF
jgi:hypothetical protein